METAESRKHFLSPARCIAFGRQLRGAVRFRWRMAPTR